jgi:hypothetical protein
METMIEIEEKPGVISSMRKNVKKAVNTGIIMIIAGIGLGTYSAVTSKSFELVSFYTLLVTAGAGLISLALGAKAWQAQSENSNTSN